MIIMKCVRKCARKYIQWRQETINSNNRKRLVNEKPTIICSNCFGGILYHWLGLRFNSPFINLFLNNVDFLNALENWNEFISTPIIEDKEAGENYPVGIGYKNIKIYFMHYSSFEDAISKWDERKKRIDMDNTFVIWSNYRGGGKGGTYLLDRFNALPFANKIVFAEVNYPDISSSVTLPGYELYCKRMRKKGKVPNVWRTKNYITGRRYVDSFDYVGWLNKCQNNNGNE